MAGVLTDTSFWVAVAFFGFMALLVYYKVPALVTKALDDRAAEIKRTLDEARALREEAQKVLADYQRKQRNAQSEAEDIIALAEREAKAYAEEARQALAESLERRSRLAEEKIARAEAQAVAEVRALAANVAVAAAEKLIAQKLTSKTADSLIDQTIADIKTKMN